MEANSLTQATGAEVVAIGVGAAEATREEVSLLGYLFWFSVSEADLRREDLIGAMADASLDEGFAQGHAGLVVPLGARGDLDPRRLPQGHGLPTALPRPYRRPLPV